jgi:signal transduction histidine kinase
MAPSLLQRLQAHRTIGGIPAAELQWVVDHGTVREIEQGALLTARAGVVEGLFVVLSGRLSLHVNRGAGLRKVMEWQGGDVTGLLPYSRLKAPPADVLAEEPTTVLLVAREHFDALVRECPALVAVCVHVMLDRARVFTSSELLDEKMMSLGRLSAGLAHELNNPASAVARNASTLRSALDDLDRATRRFCALGLSDDQCSRVRSVRESADAVAAETAARGGGPATAIEIADRQDAVLDWLDGHALDMAEPEQLVDAGLTTGHLDQLLDAVGDRCIIPVLDHLAAEQAVRRLAIDVETAATRIHTLVAAVKRFTYMDQAMVATPLQVGQGLRDTVTMLGAKARQNGVELRADVAPDLPHVEGFGGELNQIWTNLVDNAIDATPRGGVVSVSARGEGPFVVVRVTDTGTGIPADVQPRIFDPFFTTKGVGEGTGLGLDIARRLVLRHRGDIDVSTGPSGTEFRVRLPVAPPAAAVPAAAGADRIIHISEE